MKYCSFIFVILASLILIITSIFYVILRNDINYSDPVTLNGVCSNTYDCRTGLKCDNGICKTPLNGSCIWYPTSCEEGTKCIGGVCST